MAETFVPPGDTELVAFLGNLSAKLPNYLNILKGFTTTDTDAVTEDYQTLSYVVVQSDTYRTAWQERVAYKDLIKKGNIGQPGGTPPSPPAPTPVPTIFAPQGILPRTRALVQRIKTTPGYNEAIGRDLGLVAPLTQTTAPIRPSLKAKALPNGEVELTYTKLKADGALIEIQRGSDPLWTKLDKAFRSVYIDRTPLATPGQPEIRNYRVRLLIGDEPVGDYSDVVTATATP